MAIVALKSKFNKKLQKHKTSENPLKANYIQIKPQTEYQTVHIKNDYVSTLLIVCSNYFKSLLQPITVKVVYTPLLSY